MREAVVCSPVGRFGGALKVLGAQALERAGLKLSDMDLIELNEAFAAQVLGCTREWGFGEADFERLNVNGSGISLGHRSARPACASWPRC